MLAQHSALPQTKLRTALARARRAWWTAAAWRILAGSVAVSGLAVVGVWCWALLTGNSGSLVQGSTSTGTLGAVIGVALIVAGIVLTVLHVLASPSLLELARTVDHGAQQRQALSTAWEVLSGGGPNTVVAERLVAGVEAVSQGIDVSAARGRPEPWVYVMVAAWVFAALALAVPVPGRVAVVPASAPDEMTVPTWTDDELATLAGVAELLDVAAERADDQYLRAVATSFAELAADVRSGAVTAAEAESSLADLMTHLGEAARQVGGPLATAVERSMAGVPGSAAGRLSPEGGGAQLSSQTTESMAQSQGAAASTTTDDSASYYTALQSLMDELASEEGGMGLRSDQSRAGESNIDDSFYGGVLRAETDPNATTPAGPRVQAEGAGDAAGAAQRSSEGAGDAAGAGGAELFDLFDPMEPVQAAVGSEALLPRNESEAGQYVEIEMIPKADAASDRDAATEVTVPAFERAAESGSATRGVGRDHLDVISRYFTPESSIPEAP